MINLACSIFMSSNNFVMKVFLHISKCLKIHQLNTVKIIKKDCKKKACKWYQSLSKKEKEKKQQYRCERYRNLPEDEKQKLVKYKKKYYKMRKNALL